MATLLIWAMLVFCFSDEKIVYGEVNGEDSEPNPYVEALRIRPWMSVQRYVEVRKGAYQFYWLYYADGTTAGADLKPLIIWIQGGPGFAASGIGNFAEIGPFNTNFTPRNHTWVKGRNVLFIDHPASTGFSYVTDKSSLVDNDRDMAIDLSRVIKVFFRRHKEFRKTPTYIFGQSYGGKICPRLAFYLHTAIEKKKLKMNLKGIGIGSGWVDPKESTLVQPEFIYNMGIIDRNTYLKATAMVRKMYDYIDKKQYVTANELNYVLFDIINNESGMQLNFNNINQVSPYPALAKLAVKINKYVKPTLSNVVNQSLEWNYISDEVWTKMNSSFLVPSNKFLEMLLNGTKLKIVVYNGNLDVVTPIAGASNWVHKLRWPGAQEFKNAKRIAIKGDRNGFYKTAGQLSFWWVFKSGHWVPEDNPEAMQQILKYVMLE